MAQLILPVAGAIIGGIAGGPQGAQLGWMAGSIIAGIAFQETIKNRQPRLDDLKVTTAAYGTTLAFFDGAVRVAGWVAWASDRRAIEHTTSEDGKGGPKVENTSYTYEMDCLIIVSCHRFGGVRRIFQDGELVWSRAAESDYESIASSSEFCRRVTVYTGAEDQMPDPTYEAAVGVGNAPAYRERGTIALEGWNLGSSGQIRNLQFEVYLEGSDDLDIEQVGEYDTSSQGIGTPAFDPVEMEFHQPRFGAPEDSNIDVMRWRVGEGVTRIFSFPITVDTTGGFNAVPGSTDISGAMVCYTSQAATPKVSRFYYGHGGIASLTMPYDMNASQVVMTFARRNGWFVIADTSSGGGNTKKLYRYGDDGGVVSDESVALANPAQWVTICGTRVYAVTSGGIVVLELDTMDIIETISAAPGGGKLLVDESERLYQVNSSLYRLEADNSWTEVMTGVGAITDDANGYRHGVLMALQNDASLTHKTISVAWPAVTITPRTLDQVVERLCERASMPMDLVDASALAIKSTRGFAVAQPMTTRSVLDMLSSAYFFGATKHDGVIFVNRGEDTVTTIPYEDLGTDLPDSDPGEPLPVVQSNDIEVPAYVVIKYINVANDYQDGAESSDRLVTESTETSVVDMPVVMTPDEAKRLAAIVAQDLMSSTVRVGPVKLQRKHAALVPTDCIQLTDKDGSTFRARVMRRDEASDIITLDCVLDDATAITSDAVTDDDYASVVQVRLPSTTNWLELDVPLLRDQDDGAGYYAAFSAAGDNWRGATYFGGPDALNLAQIVNVADETVIGACQTTLPVWPGGNLTDVASTVVVQVDGPLDSITWEEMVAGGNTCAISSPGRWEILQFQTATLLSAGVYRLSNLLRYQLGTEGVVHGAVDSFVLLQAAGVRKVVLEMQHLEAERLYKAVSYGRSIDSVSAREFTWGGEILTPYAPVNLRVNKNAADWVVSWDRRTRRSENWLLGSVPLGEASEAYEIEFLTGSTLKRTLTSSNASVTYTAAMQAADSANTVRVYQMSDAVGRGHVLQGSL